MAHLIFRLLCKSISLSLFLIKSYLYQQGGCVRIQFYPIQLVRFQVWFRGRYFCAILSTVKKKISCFLLLRLSYSRKNVDLRLNLIPLAETFLLLFRTNPQEGFLIGSKLREKKVLIIRQFGVRAKSCYSANRQISVTALVLDMSKKFPESSKSH